MKADSGGWRESLSEAFDPVKQLVTRKYAGHALFQRQLSRPIRLVHVTDFHVGRVTPRALHFAAAEAINTLQPELVVMTGDFVCHTQDYLADLTEVISRIQAPKFAVLGNHDHWCGAAKVRGALRRGGAEVLDNSWTELRLGSERLQILGLDDPYTGHADVQRASRGLNPELATIGLSHIAEEADKLWPLGVPMVFSGHTHAGQITVARIQEWTWGKLLGHKYIHGLYGQRESGLYLPGAVYVSAGLGSSVMPLRIGELSRPEITVFDLGAESIPGEERAEQSPLPGRAPSALTRAWRRHQVWWKAQRRRRRRDLKLTND